LDSILKFSWKSKKIHVLGIDINWLDPDPAKYADLTLSGSGNIG
jgi:hypothetical protein